MSAVMHDATLSPEAKAAHNSGTLADIVYADDTLLLGSSPAFLHEFLQAVSAAGRTYGLELHEGKFQLLQVHCAEPVLGLSGTPLTSTDRLTYLGASLAADGKNGSELSRRIGMAKQDFRALCKVWRHSSLTQRRKLACSLQVVSGIEAHVWPIRLTPHQSRVASPWRIPSKVPAHNFWFGDLLRLSHFKRLR